MSRKGAQVAKDEFRTIAAEPNYLAHPQVAVTAWTTAGPRAAIGLLRGLGDYQGPVDPDTVVSLLAAGDDPMVIGLALRGATGARH
jgi:hypothetical protein